MNGWTRRQWLGATAASCAAVGRTLESATATKEFGVAASSVKEPPFSLGMVTYNVAKDWDVPTILRICKSVGIGPVELRTTHKHGVEPSLSKVERTTVRKQFADAGVSIWGCGTVCEFHEPDAGRVKGHIETCKRFVDLVADLGGKGVKVRPNGLPANVPVEKTLEQIGRALIECGNAARDAGVEIWVEVHGRGTSEPRHMKTIMEQCGHPSVGVTWNSNGTDLIDGKIEQGFDMLARWIKSCHINELYKESKGQYPYRRLFALLRESGYDRTTLIEVGKAPSDPASGEEMLRYYKALWMELAKGSPA